MLIEGIDDDLPEFDQHQAAQKNNNQNNSYALDDSTLYRAPGTETIQDNTGSSGEQREEEEGAEGTPAAVVRSSVLMPKASGKEKKKGYFSKVIKSLKSINKYIYRTKY